MFRIIVECPCGRTTIWTQDVPSDGAFSVKYGIGEDQPCCKGWTHKAVPAQDKMFERAMSNVTPIKKRGRGR